jgi:hypothetical protein
LGGYSRPVKLAGNHQNAVVWQEFGEALEGLLKQ